MSKLSPELPRSDSQEAAQAIEAVSAERNHPTAPSACARVGWEAAVRYLSAALAAQSATAGEAWMKEAERLVHEATNAACRCGMWEDEDETPYRTLFERSLATRAALLAHLSAHPGAIERAVRPELSDEQIIAIRDEHLPSQGEAFDCIAFARSIERAVSAPTQPYTDAIGEAGARYHASFPHAHHLPSLWRWEELWDAMCAAASKCAYPNCACDGPGEDGGCGSAVSAPADARPQTVRERANDLHDKAGMPMEQAVELARSEIVSYENQMIGDIMILTVLADSDAVNDQERDVLLRWIAAPSVSAPATRGDMRQAMIKLSRALGHPEFVPADDGQSVEAALIELAAERLISPAPEDERLAHPSDERLLRFAKAITAIAHTTNHCGAEYTALSEVAEAVLRDVLPEACEIEGVTCGVTIQHEPPMVAAMLGFQMPVADEREALLPCGRCGTVPGPRDACFCQKCGAVLVTQGDVARSRLAAPAAVEGLDHDAPLSDAGQASRAVNPPEFQEATWGVDSVMRPCKSPAISEYAFRQWAKDVGIALSDAGKEQSTKGPEHG